MIELKYCIAACMFFFANGVLLTLYTHDQKGVVSNIELICYQIAVTFIGAFIVLAMLTFYFCEAAKNKVDDFFLISFRRKVKNGKFQVYPQDIPLIKKSIEKTNFKFRKRFFNNLLKMAEQKVKQND